LQAELTKANKAYDSSNIEAARSAAQIAKLEAELTSLSEEHKDTLNQVIFFFLVPGSQFVS